MSNIQLSPKNEARLTQLAAKKGLSLQACVEEILNRELSLSDPEFEAGVRHALEQKEFVEEEEMEKRMEQMIKGK